MITRDRMYQHFGVTTDAAAFDAIMDHLDGEAEGRLYSTILPDNTLVVRFDPFTWSDYSAYETIGADRHEAMFNLMAGLLDQEAAQS